MEADPVDQQRQNGFIATSVVLTTMATLFVILRSISRFVLIRNPGPDDYLIIVAILFTIGYLINIMILRDNHIGFQKTMLTLDNLVTFMKVTLAIQVMYYVNICCIKMSILFTYLRFAVSNTFRKLCIGTIVLHGVFFFVCFVGTLAQCTPLSKMWDMTGTGPGSCINTTAFFYFTSAFNILTDIWILLLPIRTLRTINRPTREKYALFVIFGIGTFAAVASIVRLHTIYTYTLATDPIRQGIRVNLWSVIEVTIAISCASVSALKPLFSSRQRRITRAAMSKSGGGWSSSSGTGGSGKWYGQSQGGTGGLRTNSESSQQALQQSSQHSHTRSASNIPWHVRLMGSRDYYPAGRDVEKSADREEEQPTSTTTTSGISSGDDHPSTVAEMAQAKEVEMTFPSRRPRLVALQRDPAERGGGAAGVGAIPEPEPVRTETSETTESSMIIFSPLPPRGNLGEGGEEGGLSSSGSFLLLQR